MLDGVQVILKARALRRVLYADPIELEARLARSADQARQWRDHARHLGRERRQQKSYLSREGYDRNGRPLVGTYTGDIQENLAGTDGGKAAQQAYRDARLYADAEADNRAALEVAECARAWLAAADLDALEAELLEGWQASGHARGAEPDLPAMIAEARRRQPLEIHRARMLEACRRKDLPALQILVGQEDRGRRIERFFVDHWSGRTRAWTVVDGAKLSGASVDAEEIISRLSKEPSP